MKGKVREVMTASPKSFKLSFLGSSFSITKDAGGWRQHTTEIVKKRGNHKIDGSVKVVGKGNGNRKKVISS